MTFSPHEIEILKYFHSIKRNEFIGLLAAGIRLDKQYGSWII